MTNISKSIRITQEISTTLSVDVCSPNEEHRLPSLGAWQTLRVRITQEISTTLSVEVCSPNEEHRLPSLEAWQTLRVRIIHEISTTLSVDVCSPNEEHRLPSLGAWQTLKETLSTSLWHWFYLRGRFKSFLCQLNWERKTVAEMLLVCQTQTSYILPQFCCPISVMPILVDDTILFTKF